jgi:hypothetical protein
MILIITIVFWVLLCGTLYLTRYNSKFEDVFKIAFCSWLVFSMSVSFDSIIESTADSVPPKIFGLIISIIANIALFFCAEEILLLNKKIKEIENKIESLKEEITKENQ